ncbi:MAG: S41 family peptidase [Marinilabiliaceae bacterium]|nr:S41 family peptidase [Marinilabiliaceae bacterium]
MNSNFKKLLMPILLAVATVVGVVLGRLSKPMVMADGGGIQIMQMPQGTNKLQHILDAIDMYYVDDVLTDTILEKAIPQIIEELDPHTAYIPAKDLENVNSELKSNFGGIGVQFLIMQDTVNVVSVINEGPSSALGLLPGDKIIKVNGYEFTGKKLNNQMVLDSLRGEIGTTVNVTIKRPGVANIDYDIVRGLIPMYSVITSYMVTSEIGYMLIDRFAERTYEEMLQGVAKLKSNGCKGIIIDLRSNQGGLLDVVIRMCNEFLETGDLIVYTEGLHQSRQEARADGKGVCRDMGVAVLIDEYSASASEIFAGAIQDNDRGIILGRRSFGKGLVQTQLELPDHSALRLTIARYHTPSGRCIQRPYSDGRDDYYHEMSRRYAAGEFFEADSVKNDATQQYKTKKGRVVFGGGGIMPDIFVPHDSTKASAYLYELRAKGVLRNYALEYSNRNRGVLTAMSTSELVDFLERTSLLNELRKYAAGKGVTPKESLNVAERDIIEREVKAYIGRTIGDDEVFYTIINKEDEIITKAVNVVSQTKE